MDFDLTEEERLIRDTFRDFANRDVRPAARDLDEHPRFPHDLFRQVGALGYFAMRYPEPAGSGAGVLAWLLATEELARGSLALAAACTMQALMGTWFVHRFAPEDVKARLLVPALRGERVATIAMTEPDAGSDLHAITTRAQETRGGFRLTGRKTWCTSAPVADFFTVLARTSEKGLGFFLVERTAPGLAVGKPIEKLGVRASPTSEVYLDDAHATCPLGLQEEGALYLREILPEIRLVTAALALGVGTAAFEEARAYAAERRQFGRPIKDFQAVAAHLAETATELEAARHLVEWAACRISRGTCSPPEASMAKLFASEAATRACDRAARVLASYGYAMESPVQRYLRDVRFTLIGGGTSEILKVGIAKGLYGPYPEDRS